MEIDVTGAHAPSPDHNPSPIGQAQPTQLAFKTDGLPRPPATVTPESFSPNISLEEMERNCWGTLDTDTDHPIRKSDKLGAVLTAWRKLMRSLVLARVSASSLTKIKATARAVKRRSR